MLHTIFFVAYFSRYTLMFLFYLFIIIFFFTISLSRGFTDAFFHGFQDSFWYSSSFHRTPSLRVRPVLNFLYNSLFFPRKFIFLSPFRGPTRLGARHQCSLDIQRWSKSSLSRQWGLRVTAFIGAADIIEKRCLLKECVKGKKDRERIQNIKVRKRERESAWMRSLDSRFIMLNNHFVLH